MGFRVLELNNAEWDTVVTGANAPVFYSREYCNFRFDPTKTRAIMFHFECEHGSVFDVSVARDVSTLPFFSPLESELKLRPIDLCSPEYNGPIVSSEIQARPAVLSGYRQGVLDFCDKNSVVTEFVRFHPLIGLGPELGGTAVNPVVYIDLRQGYEVARQRFRKSHKWRINKALREGARADFGPASDSAVHSLATLYDRTMQNRGAKSIDYRPEEFFQRFFRSFGKSAFLLQSYMGDTLVSASVFLRGGKEFWYLYSGNVSDLLLKTGAHTFAMDQVIRWAAIQNLDYLILGGGVTAQDGVFEFKTGFSHLLAHTFHLRRVHNQELMDRLCQAKAEYNETQGKPLRTDYFPSYWLD